MQFLECIEPVVRYVESQMERTRVTVNGGEGELLSLLSGSGTPQVDVVFYVILHSEFVPTARVSLEIGIYILVYRTQTS